MIKHEVPFYSQKTHITEKEWQPKGCGVTALKMILEYWKLNNPVNQSPHIAELMAKGLDIKAYVTDIGWSHQGLVNLAHNFGYGGYNMDLAKISREEAWDILTADLIKYPLIVSVYPKFDPDKIGGHIVTLTGMYDGMISLHDPEEASANLGTKIIKEENFLKGWKQRYIVIKPIT